ncbi:MAG: hypothetical protein R3F65_29775 [bacterium]
MAEAVAGDGAVRAGVAGLARFEPGRVAAVGRRVAGVPVAGAGFDRLLAARVAAAGGGRRGGGRGARVAVVVTHDVDAFDGLSWFGVRAAGWAAAGARALWRGDRAGARRTARRARAWAGWWRRGSIRWRTSSGGWRWRGSWGSGRRSSSWRWSGRCRGRGGCIGWMIRGCGGCCGRWWRGGGRWGCTRRGSGAIRWGLAAQRERLEAAAGARVRAVRHHYLSARFPMGWRVMRAAGFEVSSNVGFHPPGQGFRTGTAWPHRPLGAAGPWEVPMALMDAAHGPVAAGLWPVFEALVAEAAAVGVVVLNFHTNYRAEVDAPGVHRAFERIARWCRGAADRGEVALMTLDGVVDHVAAAAGVGGGASDGAGRV